MNENIFRAYDIRGIFGKDLTTEIAEKIGKAFGTFIGEGKNLVVGRDVRLSGKALSDAVISGLTSVGCNVTNIGIVPTPILYFAIAHQKYDGGIVVTASHNPSEWNGFHLCKERGLFCAQGSGMEKVKDLVLKNRFKRTKRIGKVETYNKIFRDYTDFVLSKIKVRKKFKIVLDCSNGTTALITPRLLELIGCEVVALNGEPDGRFPAHLPEPNEETLKKLKEKVVELKADLGVGYDCDGDRAVFVDERGRIVNLDKTPIIFIDDVLKKTKNAKILYDVSCSLAIEEFIKNKNGIPLISKVGHAFFPEKMINMNISFGCERSAHYYFSETYGFDDGTFSTLKMIEILSNSGKSLSEIADSLPHYYTTQKNFACDDKAKFEIIKNLKIKFSKLGFNINDLDGMKAFDEESWVLIRPSNTEPLIRIFAEAKNENKLKKLFGLGESLLKEEIKV